MPWYDAYRAYDDDTLVALANAGLLRRAAKDLAAGAIDWTELAQRLAAAAGLAAEPFDAVLLRPSATQAPRLDEIRQQIESPVQDAPGRWLTLVVPARPNPSSAPTTSTGCARGAWWPCWCTSPARSRRPR